MLNVKVFASRGIKLSISQAVMAGRSHESDPFILRQVAEPQRRKWMCSKFHNDWHDPGNPGKRMEMGLPVTLSPAPLLDSHYTLLYWLSRELPKSPRINVSPGKKSFSTLALFIPDPTFPFQTAAFLALSSLSPGLSPQVQVQHWQPL